MRAFRVYTVPPVVFFCGPGGPFLLFMVCAVALDDDKEVL